MIGFGGPGRLPRSRVKVEPRWLRLGISQIRTLRPVLTGQDRRDPGLGTEERDRAGHKVRRTGTISLRGARRTVLAAGEPEVV